MRNYELYLSSSRSWVSECVSSGKKKLVRMILVLVACRNRNPTKHPDWGQRWTQRIIHKFHKYWTLHIAVWLFLEEPLRDPGSFWKNYYTTTLYSYSIRGNILAWWKNISSIPGFWFDPEHGYCLAGDLHVFFRFSGVLSPNMKEWMNECTCSTRSNSHKFEQIPSCI